MPVTPTRRVLTQVRPITPPRRVLTQVRPVTPPRRVLTQVGSVTPTRRVPMQVGPVASPIGARPCSSQDVRRLQRSPSSFAIAAPAVGITRTPSGTPTPDCPQPNPPCRFSESFPVELLTRYRTGFTCEGGRVAQHTLKPWSHALCKCLRHDAELRVNTAGFALADDIITRLRDRRT